MPFVILRDSEPDPSGYPATRMESCRHISTFAGSFGPGKQPRHEHATSSLLSCFVMPCSILQATGCKSAAQLLLHTNPLTHEIQRAGSQRLGTMVQTYRLTQKRIMSCSDEAQVTDKNSVMFIACNLPLAKDCHKRVIAGSHTDVYSHMPTTDANRFG